MVRIKNRWLLVEFLPVDDGALVLSEKTIWAAVKQSVVHNFGDAGWGGIGVSLSASYRDSYDDYLDNSERDINALKDY
ncbi:hypothetical protein FB107DRAFT_268527 [Schizophyllum commune]